MSCPEKRITNKKTWNEPGFEDSRYDGLPGQDNGYTFLPGL
jgi:hypothetical protein